MEMQRKHPRALAVLVRRIFSHLSIGRAARVFLKKIRKTVIPTDFKLSRVCKHGLHVITISHSMHSRG